MRRIDWQGCLNTRDLGGLGLGAGRTVRSGIVFRSGSLAGLPPDTAARFVREFGLATYLDLRTAGEVARDGFSNALVSAGVRWVHMPLGQDDYPLRNIARPQPSDYARSYLHLLRTAPDAVGAVLAYVAAADAPLVFGCSLGKDRTGVVAALILLACGAPEMQVVNDYTLSSRQLRKAAPELQANWQRKGLSQQAYRRRLEATRMAMTLFLQDWRGDAPHIEAAFRPLSVGDALLERLRSRLTHPAPSGSPGWHTGALPPPGGDAALDGLDGLAGQASDATPAWLTALKCTQSAPSTCAVRMKRVHVWRGGWGSKQVLV